MRLAPTRLYLDTARLGLMNSSAKRANTEFAKLLSEEGLSLYATRWLAEGSSTMPAGFVERFTGLADWPGIGGLKNLVRRLADVHSSRRVLFASRSTALARLAVTELVTRCERPLTVDLLWPCYQALLAKACRRRGKPLTIVPVRNRILQNQADSADTVRHVIDVYHRRNCDGVFLPSVTHDGIRFPAADLLRAIAPTEGGTVSVVDGAQALGHVTTDDSASIADIYLSSAHKWLGAGFPLGMAICRGGILRALNREDRRSIAPPCHDSLLSLTQQIAAGQSRAFGETVHTAALVTGWAAISDALNRNRHTETHQQLMNHQLLVEVAQSADWLPVEPRSEFRTGILLLHATSHRIRRLSSAELSESFQRLGLAATCYPGGWARLSAPRRMLRMAEADYLGKVLDFVAYGRKTPRHSHFESSSSDAIA